MVTKRKIKNLTADRLKMNKEEIIEKIQEHAGEYNSGAKGAKFVIITYFTVLGLSDDEARDAFYKIIES